tara:strand:- start:1054 stop:1335 length:282 start_codon:yes stop_codon:yes gene_type:complete
MSDVLYRANLFGGDFKFERPVSVGVDGGVMKKGDVSVWDLDLKGITSREMYIDGAWSERSWEDVEDMARERGANLIAEKDELYIFAKWDGVVK